MKPLKIDCVMLDTGPVATTERHPEVRRCIIDFDRRNAWLTPSVLPAVFKKAVFATGFRQAGRFILCNRNLDVPLDLREGPKPEDADGRDTPRFAGQQRITAADRFDAEERFGMEEAALPLQRRNPDWMMRMIAFSLAAAVLVAAIKLLVRIAVTGGAPAP